jgi:hypothetical protein
MYMSTFVPLLQLFLVEVGRFLQVGELLLGQLALAVVIHNQLLVLQVCVCNGSPRRQLVPEGSNCICESDTSCSAVAGISWLVAVGDIGVVLARKLEGRVRVLEKGYSVRGLRYVGERRVAAVATAVVMAVVVVAGAGRRMHGCGGVWAAERTGARRAEAMVQASARRLHRRAARGEGERQAAGSMTEGVTVRMTVGEVPRCGTRRKRGLTICPWLRSSRVKCTGGNGDGDGDGE